MEVGCQKARWKCVDIVIVVFIKTGLFLFIFALFSHCKDKYITNLTTNVKSIDGVLGSRTWGGRMGSTDKSTDLRREPYCFKD